MFVLQNNRLPDVSRQELNVTPMQVGEGTGTAKFDLTLALEETDQGLVGGLEYKTRPVRRRDDRADGRALRGAARRDHRRPRDQAVRPALVDRRRAKPIAGSMGPAPTAAAERPSGLIHELFEAHARRSPDAPAVVAGEARWTYRALNASANRLVLRPASAGHRAGVPCGGVPPRPD